MRIKDQDRAIELFRMLARGALTAKTTKLAAQDFLRSIDVQWDIIYGATPSHGKLINEDKKARRGKTGLEDRVDTEQAGE